MEIELSNENRENKAKYLNMLLFPFIYRINLFVMPNSMHSFIAHQDYELGNRTDNCYEDETSLTSMKPSLISPGSDPAMLANLLMWHNI